MGYPQLQVVDVDAPLFGYMGVIGNGRNAIKTGYKIYRNIIQTHLNSANFQPNQQGENEKQIVRIHTLAWDRLLPQPKAHELARLLRPRQRFRLGGLGVPRLGGPLPHLAVVVGGDNDGGGRWLRVLPYCNRPGSERGEVATQEVPLYLNSGINCVGRSNKRRAVPCSNTGNGKHAFLSRNDL